MNRLISSIAILVAGTMVVPTATAQQQRAPVTRGVTSTDLAGTVNELRQRNAQMDLEISRLEDEIGKLNGEIETLKFLLSQSRDESARMQEDDKRIGQALSDITDRNDRLERRLSSLENQIGSLSGQMADSGMTSSDSPSSQDRPVQSRQGTSGSADQQGTAQGERRVIRSTTSGSASAGQNGDPSYQGSLGSLQASNLPGEAGPLFAAAKSRLLKFDYAGAEEAFRAFLDRFSDDPQAGEAQYWLAETLFQQEAYGESGEAYLKMIREYPGDARAPDALVKVARSMRLVGDTEKACEALRVLPQQYPNASGVTKNLAALERTRAGCGA